ncbi:hypothetical protein GOP47_0016597 [Adiantum capillus-veneris]|uniref:Fe2OG dioxygenase domain-containing protein n=1 Tax=Adiantum capillus-veneris TaxID=13818 RepID=A0A9D4UID6_ADICA|nr:hypothetical protein GOP47_0016597 [Adiantum capillus-veneris]
MGDIRLTNLQVLNMFPCKKVGKTYNSALYASTFLSAKHKRLLLNCGCQVKEPSPVFEEASEIGIPGLCLFKNFVEKLEEQELLAAVDEQPWQALSKRRVQHYGYEFQYKIRNVDIMQNMGKLPKFTDCILKRISALPELITAEEVSMPLDQLTVNEYPPGVGLSPHIDTHSAFEGAIVCLSLAGPCLMEFRKYETETDSDASGLGHIGVCEDPESISSLNGQRNAKIQRCPIQCRPIFLPERSLLVLLGEARYRWHHYIPHHKVDFVNGRKVQRKERRVSFTFRKVRRGPCHCIFRSVCDSQMC